MIKITFFIAMLCPFLWECEMASKKIKIIDIDSIEIIETDSLFENMSSRKPFGIYQWTRGVSYADRLKREIEIIGVVPQYIMEFLDLRDRPTRLSERLRVNDSVGAITLLSQDFDLWGGGVSNKVLDEITNGDWNAYFISLAKQLKEYGKLIYYRPGYEMNGDWMIWGERPEAFVTAWLKIYEIFRDENASNVKWVFSPNILWGRKIFHKDMKPYYPGDSVVDVVALDGYNFGDHFDQWHSWKTFSELYNRSIKAVRSHWDKPIWIAEMGCAADRGKPGWLVDFLMNYGRLDIAVFIWYQEDKSHQNASPENREANWRLDSDSTTLKIFQKWAKLPVRSW